MKRSAGSSSGKYILLNGRLATKQLPDDIYASEVVRSIDSKSGVSYVVEGFDLCYMSKDMANIPLDYE